VFIPGPGFCDVKKEPNFYYRKARTPDKNPGKSGFLFKISGGIFSGATGMEISSKKTYDAPSKK
jgi:hypothetical protein